ncbi:MAG: hypothetical protein JSV78_00290, partial [Phycisphaerales bacterium]
LLVRVLVREKRAMVGARGKGVNVRIRTPAPRPGGGALSSRSPLPRLRPATAFPTIGSAMCLCPKLTFEAWEGREVSFDGKPFLTRRIPLFFRLPVGLGEEIEAVQAKGAALSLDPAMPPMVLQRDRGIFRGELLWAIGGEVKLPEITLVSGKYRASVHRGSYTQLGRAARKHLRRLRHELGIRPDELFFWYANCPKCWDEPGGPVTIILARIGNPEAAVKGSKAP